MMLLRTQVEVLFHSRDISIRHRGLVLRDSISNHPSSSYRSPPTKYLTKNDFPHVHR